MGVRLAFGPKRRFVHAHEPGNGESGLTSAREKVSAGAKGIGKLRGDGRRVLAGTVPDDEAAADREPGFVSKREALSVARHEAHGVRMFWRRRQPVEDDRALGVEGD